MSRLSRRLSLALLSAAAFVVSSCGSGTGFGVSSGSGSSAFCSNVPGLSTSFGTPTGANVVPITVDSGPTVNGVSVNAVNQAYVKITVCMPGTTSCQTIDHVWLDTGSTGLRLVSSVLTKVSLPPSMASPGPVGICGQSLGSYSWGALRAADVHIGGETALNVPVQVTGDASVPAAAPTNCSNGHAEMDTVMQLGANGLLGIGPFLQDCGLTCAQAAQTGHYYTCPSPSGSCSPTTMPVADQLQNVVSQFTTIDNGVMDNNGSLIQIHWIPPQGVASAGGWLIFGIDTQANNQLGTALVFPADPTYGYINTTTTYGSTSNPSSRLDSGITAWFFNNPALTTCSGNSGFFCSTAMLSATMTAYQGFTGQAPSNTYDFCVQNLDSLNSAFAAFNDLGGPVNAGTFDWGLPFFYGRSVFTAIEGGSGSIGGHPTPFFAASTP